MDENLRAQILRMKREGKTYTEIAESLFISKSTISKALVASTGEYQRRSGATAVAVLLPKMAKNAYIAEKRVPVPSVLRYRTTEPEMAGYFDRIREVNIQRNAHLEILKRMSSDDELLGFVKPLLWAMVVGIILYLIFKKRENVEIFESVTRIIPDPIESLPPLARLSLTRMARESMARA